jgi:protein gp37
MGGSVETAEYRYRVDHLRRTPARVHFVSFVPLLGALGEVDLTGIHWAIVGGESGPEARPMQDDWVLSLRDQCLAAGVA